MNTNNIVGFSLFEKSQGRFYAFIIDCDKNFQKAIFQVKLTKKLESIVNDFCERYTVKELKRM